MTLTPETYRTPESEKAFASVSQIKAFQECEAAALARLNGKYMPEEAQHFLVGRYVHTGLLQPEKMAQFIEKHRDEVFKQIGKNKGDKYAEYVTADKMIEAVNRSKTCMNALDGDNELIVTFEIDGHPFKSQLDAPDGVYKILSDFKTVKNFSDDYSKKHRQRVPFYEIHNYWMQMACYREAYKAHYGFYPEVIFIVAATKEQVPDVKLLEMSDAHRLETELSLVKQYLPRLSEIKSGKVLPTSCGVCDYCKQTKEIVPELAISYWPKD